MQCKRNRFSLDRKVEILKFHRDILLETSPVIIDFHHYVASRPGLCYDDQEELFRVNDSLRINRSRL